MKLMKLLMRPFSRLNARRYIKSKGTSMGTLAGRDICVASMTGARSGKQRDVPLMYVPYREGVILVASLGARRSTPPGTTTW
jgi:hypothetical protein